MVMVPTEGDLHVGESTTWLDFDHEYAAIRRIRDALCEYGTVDIAAIHGLTLVV